MTPNTLTPPPSPLPPPFPSYSGSLTPSYQSQPFYYQPQFQPPPPPRHNQPNQPNQPNQSYHTTISLYNSPPYYQPLPPLSRKSSTPPIKLKKELDYMGYERIEDIWYDKDSRITIFPSQPCQQSFTMKQKAQEILARVWNHRFGRSI